MTLPIIWSIDRRGVWESIFTNAGIVIAVNASADISVEWSDGTSTLEEGKFIANNKFKVIYPKKCMKVSSTELKKYQKMK